MADKTSDPRAIASIFDLRRLASRQDLLHLVGQEDFPQFEAHGKPFVALILEGPDAAAAPLPFEDDAQVIEFYRSILRMNRDLPERERTHVVPRHLSPELHAELLIIA